VEAVTAFVLAGGRSSRMGTDKALLSFGGQTLLQRALRIAGAVAQKTVIGGRKENYGNFGEVVEDIYPECGPLGGIHAALKISQSELNLIISVDMPLLTVGFLRWLLSQASASEELIVVPDALGGPQPLCAVYRRALLPEVTQALQNGDYKIGHLFTRAPTRMITEREILAAGFSSEVFRNVNTVAEYEALLRTMVSDVGVEQRPHE
jgi:molybdopterin-guanine dinucleotide biosynthesis protein A